MTFQRKAGQTDRARALRQRENPAEASLWLALRDRRLGSHKFVRQFPIGPYFADFACRASRLVVEVDGGQHVENLYDQRRDVFILGRGYAILRFPSALVLSERESVCATIQAALERKLTGNVDTLDMKFTQPLS